MVRGPMNPTEDEVKQYHEDVQQLRDELALLKALEKQRKKEERGRVVPNRADKRRAKRAKK